MRLLFLLFVAFTSLTAMKQSDSWRVLLSSATLLITTEENPEKNTITISRSELVANGALTVAYTDKAPEKGWKREIVVVDEEENELAKKGSNKIVISHNQLKGIVAKGISTFHFYTWTLPTDPDKAALVRVRRVHLCTIIVK